MHILLAQIDDFLQGKGRRTTSQVMHRLGGEGAISRIFNGLLAAEPEVASNQMHIAQQAHFTGHRRALRRLK